MKKVKNNDENKQEEIEKKPSKIKMFFEYYKYVPGFKALVKLGLYFIFFAVIISVVACNKDTINQNPEKESTEEKKEMEISYKDMLEALTNNNIEILYNITVNEEIYRIDATRKDNILSGIYRTKDSIHEFRIQDNIVYEIGLNEEKENIDLFNNINLNYLLPEQLISMLEVNKATKTLENEAIIYNYEIEEVKYRVIINNNWINKIEIADELSNYVIEYNKSEVN